MIRTDLTAGFDNSTSLWVPAYEGDFEILPDPNSFDFQFTGKSFVKFKLSMILLEASPRG